MKQSGETNYEQIERKVPYEPISNVYLFPSVRQDGIYLNVLRESYKDEMLSYRTSFEKYTYMSQTAGHSLWDLGYP